MHREECVSAKMALFDDHMSQSELTTTKIHIEQNFVSQTKYKLTSSYKFCIFKRTGGAFAFVSKKCETLLDSQAVDTFE